MKIKSFAIWEKTVKELGATLNTKSSDNGRESIVEARVNGKLIAKYISYAFHPKSNGGSLK